MVYEMVMGDGYRLRGCFYFKAVCLFSYTLGKKNMAMTCDIIDISAQEKTDFKLTFLQLSR